MPHEPDLGQVSISISGVSRLAVLELEEELGSLVTIDERPRTTLDYGDLTTITAVVIVSTAALSNLSIWIAKQRSRSVARQEIEIHRADGSTYRHILEFKSSSEDAIAADVLNQLSRLMHSEVDL